MSPSADEERAMRTPSILVATWAGGLFGISGNIVRQEIADQPVRGLAADGRGGALAIAGGHSLHRRSPDGKCAAIAESEFELSCCVAIADTVFLGTEDAHVLRLDAGGSLQRLTGFDAVDGRDAWYAGAAMIDGKLIGPPLAIRSMTATCDGAVLLANVHVGGIPRSTDGGRTWAPTIDIDTDVHQVCAHPSRSGIVIAAAAAGLCISRDAGATWSIEREGLHAHYCSAVAMLGDDLLVAASTDHFAAKGALYRRPVDGEAPLRPLGGGMPAWIDGIADTGCIATRDSTAAAIDRSGCVYLSHDEGATWAAPFERLPCPSALLIC
jgi:hypothetical protein